MRSIAGEDKRNASCLKLTKGEKVVAVRRQVKANNRAGGMGRPGKGGSGLTHRGGRRVGPKHRDRGRQGAKDTSIAEGTVSATTVKNELRSCRARGQSNGGGTKILRIIFIKKV